MSMMCIYFRLQQFGTSFHAFHNTSSCKEWTLKVFENLHIKSLSFNIWGCDNEWQQIHAFVVGTFCPLTILVVTYVCNIRILYRWKWYDIVYVILRIPWNYDSAVFTISHILGFRNEYIWVSLTDALIIFLVCSIVFGFEIKNAIF